ncbi:MAG: FISUMP domain-containing protein [Bacteroidales bacterium]
MKKIINYSGIPGLVLISALFFLPFSCNKDRVQDNPNSVISSQLIKVSGEDANAATKTTLSGLVTSWVVTTDKVGIYSPQAHTATAGGGSTVVNAEFTAASSGTSSNFTGTMYWGAASTSHTFYAYYPWVSGTAASTVVPVSLPSAQTQSAAGNNAHIGALDFMVATPVTVTSPANTNATSGVNLKYNHLFTVLEFQIKGSGTLKAVKLSGSNTLAFSGGTIDITQATPATGVAYAFASQTGTSTQAVVTLTTPATLTSTNADTKVYMVINPGTQAGNCLIGVSSDGTTWKYISKMALSGGFLRGNKYVVSVDAATATDPVDDIDGNTYTTVTIGTQVWMAQNLKTTKYNDGTDIPNVTVPATWGGRTQGAYCWYGNDAGTYKATYGALYNWYTVDNNASTRVASNGGKNVCPVGWHVPTDAEWTTLTDYLGGLSVAGGKLKETGTTHWTTPNTGATNENGFTALPGGIRYADGNPTSYIGSYGYLWSSSLNSENYPINYYASYISSNFTLSQSSKTLGASVRCVKN